MTTEIAIINRLGVALATDSAVTISGGGRTKVFNTADKLFELSEHHPVGIMINGNMDCLSVPWEILIKAFREREGSRHRNSIDQWLTDFMKFVEGHDTLSDQATILHVEQVTQFELNALSFTMFKAFREFLGSVKPSKRRGAPDFDFGSVLFEKVSERIKRISLVRRAESLEGISEEQIKDAYGDLFTRVAKETFAGRELSPEECLAISDLMAALLLSTEGSELATGIVVAGYGHDDPFPSVHAVEVDGKVLGRLKFTQVERESIQESEDKGRVIPFAQTDVIQRLLGAADPRFVSQTADFIEQAVLKVGQQVEKSLRPRRAKKQAIDRREKMVAEIAELVANEYENEAAEKLRREFEREFDRMVALMPKQELIELAEALVSITGAERKATKDEGTVGGPIDVAMITKHEGFVWIKRKHYFNKDLNPRFMWRKYGRLQREVTL